MWYNIAMITLIIAIVVAGGVFASTHYVFDWSLIWSIVMGVVGFGVFQVLMSILIQRRVKADMLRVQDILMGGQTFATEDATLADASTGFASSGAKGDFRRYEVVREISIGRNGEAQQVQTLGADDGEADRDGEGAA